MCIKKTISLSINPDQAFKAFVNDFNDWWPKEYTWSKDALREIRLGKAEGDLCTEIGPDGFRCDWGRISTFEKRNKNEFRWQISPNREPIPNPENASNIIVQFSTNDEIKTTVQFEHVDFDNHGEDGSKYKAMMDSPQGWPFILERYKNYCKKEIK